MAEMRDEKKGHERHVVAAVFLCWPCKMDITAWSNFTALLLWKTPKGGGRYHVPHRFHVTGNLQITQISHQDILRARKG